VLGIVVLAVLGLLLVRLWTMQVIHGEAFATQAKQNRVREVTMVSPRGRILDRNGALLVSNRATTAVFIDPSGKRDDALLARLAAVLRMPVADVRARAQSVKEAALAPRMIAIDAAPAAVAYISEHPDDFPGVDIRAQAVRQYPKGMLAAHVLGYAGEVSQNDLNSQSMNGYQYGDIVGKAGAELSFEKVLQGDRGTRLLEVDAGGKPRSVIQETDPVPGRDVVLTIDSKVQAVAEQALVQAIADAHKAKFTKATAGAAVVLDVKTGEVLAMASVPTYDPSMFLGGISQKDWSALTSKASDYPLTNRAIMGQYPAASTFKLVTGLGGLQYRLVSSGTSVDCTGQWDEMGKQWKKWCWDHAGHGVVDFRKAIRDSCDSYFYHLGYLFYKDHGEKLQQFARTFGFGSDSGIDLPGEASGRVPDAAWKAAYNQNYPEYQNWQPGDTVNLSIGQGDLLVTPLQIADAYAGVANGGKVMTPHVLKRVLGLDGKPVLTYKPTVAYDTKCSDANLTLMRESLLQVTQGGTGRAAFSGFAIDIAGKTGTAQVAGKDDYAWYVGFAPAENPKYCVAVLIEQGGHGGSVAGPAARNIFASLFNLKIEHISATDPSR